MAFQIMPFLKKPVVAITTALIGGTVIGVVASRYGIWRKPIILGQEAMEGLSAEQIKAKMDSVRARREARKAAKQQTQQQAQQPAAGAQS